MALMNYTFNDITTEDMFDFRYNESEEFLGHRFIHIGSGIFKAEEFFDLSMEELKKELGEYSDHIGVAGCLHSRSDFGWKESDRFTVMYAMNMLWCNLALENDCGDGSRGPEVLLRWLIKNNEGGNLKYEEDTELYGFYKYREKYRCFSRKNLYGIEDDDYVSTEDPRTAFEPANRIKGKLGDRPVINIRGHLAGMVEPHIYYFPEDLRDHGGLLRCSSPEIDLNMVFEEPCSMLGFSTDFHPSPFCGIKYFAVGEKATERLQEIAQNTDYFFHQFRVKSGEAKAPEPVLLNEILEDKKLDLKTKKCSELKTELRSQRESEIESLIKEGKAEVVVSGTPGLDFRNIKVYYKTLLYEAHKSENYEFVYVKDGRLFLENVKWNTNGEEEGAFVEQAAVYVDALTELVLSKELPLNNGTDYPVSITVFHRKQEVLERFIKEGMLELVEETEGKQ